MLELAVKSLIGYLLGSLMGALIVGALNFLPALGLGPIVEHFMMVH